MRIIARRTLTEFAASRAGQPDHAALVNALDAWYDETRKSSWATSSDVRQSFAAVSVVGADRLVFNIRGNAYRLVTAVDYARGILWIKWIGTHADYDDIDVRTVQYGD
jgi:mRNA interferase HigB